jgi:hypothetical protein
MKLISTNCSPLFFVFVPFFLLLFLVFCLFFLKLVNCSKYVYKDVNEQPVEQKMLVSNDLLDNTQKTEKYAKEK